MVCSIAGVWREARDPPAQAQSEKRKRGNFEKFGARSSKELGFRERQAKFSAFVYGIRRAWEIFGSRSVRIRQQS